MCIAGCTFVTAKFEVPGCQRALSGSGPDGLPVLFEFAAQAADLERMLGDEVRLFEGVLNDPVQLRLRGGLVPWGG